MQLSGKPNWAPEKAVTFWINHASRLIMRHFEQRLRPLDFGIAYLPVVVALDENGSLLQKDLARLAYVEQPTMAALLARMERDRLIIRQPHLTDKRASRISLSRKAKDRLPAAKEQLMNVIDLATSGFSEKERIAMIALLQRVVNNLESPVD